MIASVVAALHHRRAAKFAAPDNQRIVQHAALFEVFDQCGTRLVRVAAVFLEVGDEIAVLIPGFVEDFNKPHAFLGEPARKQAGICVCPLARFGAIHFKRLLRFLA